MTNHIWFVMTKDFEALGELKEGDKIEFHARVKHITGAVEVIVKMFRSD